MSGKKFHVSFLVGITVLVLLFNMIPAFAGYAEAAVKSAVVTTNGVNVRSGPGISYNKIGMVNKGENYDVVQQSNGWANLKISPSVLGWVKELYLMTKNGSEAEKAADSNTVKTIAVNADNVNLRSGPGTKFAIVGKAAKGQQFVTTKQSGGWYYINIGQGKFGWIIAQFATVKASAVTTNPLKPVPPTPTPPTPAPVDSEAVDLTKSLLVIKASIVNVRVGAGTGFGLVSKVKAGDRLKVLKKNDQWYLVQLAGGKQGWVAGWLGEMVVSDTMSRDGTDVSTKPATEPATEPTTEPETQPETGMSPGSGEGSGVPVPPAKIQSIEFAGSESVQEQLVIKSEGDIKFNVSSLNQPDRLVIDLQNSDVNNIKDFSTGRVLVSNVRVAQFSANPMVVRIVLDLNKIVSYTAKVDDDGKILTLNLSEPSIKGKVIVVDAGHGGYDPGAIGVTGLSEKDFNLDLALKLREKLTALEATVIMTRVDDTFISLSGRASVANQVYADIFVSIHANSSYTPSKQGTSTYYYTPSTIPSLYLQREQRQKLALKVQDRLVAQLGTGNIGILQANFAVLRETQMPSILVESAFLSNANDEALLKDDHFRDKEAQAITDGLLDYFAN